MNKIPIPLLVAIITAIIGPTVTIVIQNALAESKFKEIAPERASAMTGRWDAYLEQDFKGESIRYEGSMTVAIHEKTLTGDLYCIYTDKTGKRFDVNFKMTGRMLYDRFIKYDYFSDKNGAIHFGSMILELNSEANGLVGHFLAFGAYSQKIVDGPIILTKKN